MKEEIQLSQDRRDGIINFLLEWLTGPDIDSRTLGHFRFIGEMFGINSKVKEMCRASSIQGRQELAVSVSLAALNLAVSDEPVQPTERQIERREARAAAREFEQRVAVAGKPTTPTKTQSDKVSPHTLKWREKVARMTPYELEAFRSKERERLRAYHARKVQTRKPSAN
jgi:hypothetical protein